MASKTDIANLAIAHIGIGKEISNLETERSEEAIACRKFYDLARQAVLSDLDWSFSTRFEDLALVETSPTDEWSYSYRYPSFCLNIRRIVSGTRNDTLKSRVPFRVVSDDLGYLIYTDMEQAKVEFTYDITNSEFFPAEFVMALSFRLAMYIVTTTSGGDPFKKKEELLGQYQMEINRAKRKNLNEDGADIVPNSELITYRN
jgi:hypothetical protein